LALETLQEQFTWRYRFELSHDGSPSVVVNYLNVLCASIGPAEANAPLIIDADAVLFPTFPLQRQDDYQVERGGLQAGPAIWYS